MRKMTGILLALLSFFIGMSVGYLVAPAKGGYGGFGNNSGNTNHYYYGKEDTNTNIL